ncbi:hypothetical protein TWF281_004866 [Arthrobotrys megalospora]
MECGQGEFLLAQLYVRSLEDKTTVKAVKASLKKFRKHSRDTTENERLALLADAYDQTMNRVLGQKAGFRQLAESVLQWVIYANRLLTVSELQHALGVEVNESELDKENLPQVEEIISVCAGLVIADKESGIVRLVHYTTQDYFEQTKEKWFFGAETYIANICISYLSFNSFTSGRCRTDAEFNERKDLNCLYDYAAKNWGHHVRKTSGLSSRVINFFDNKAKLESLVQAMRVVRPESPFSKYTYDSQQDPSAVTGLHLAAFFGLELSVVNTLISKGRCPNFTDSHGRTPLSWAAETGEIAVGNLLIESGAQVDLADVDGRTPLLWAVNYGHVRMTELLIRNQANVNAIDIFGVTALHLGARRCYLAAMSLLLESGADANTKDLLGGTPLAWALENDSDAAAQMLLALSARVNYTYRSFQYRSMYFEGYEAIRPAPLPDGDEYSFPEYHLRRRATLARQDRFFYYGMTTHHRWSYDEDGAKGHYVIPKFSLLLRAVEKKDETLIKILIAKGLQPDLESGGGLTPLSAAVRGGNAQIVNLLITTDSFLNQKFEHGRSLLSLAAENGNLSVVRLLLKKGSNPESKDSIGRTPLCRAAERGHLDVVSLLLTQPGVDPGLEIEGDENDMGWTPLSWAAKNGHEAVVKLLLMQPGVNPDSKITGKHFKGRTPLSFASERGCEAVVACLLDTGRVDPDSRSELHGLDRQGRDTSVGGRTPTSYAAAGGYETIVKLLLNTGRVDPDSREDSGRTPLSYAAFGGHETIVKLLLDTGRVDADSRDDSGRTPLSYAALSSHETIVKLLLDTGRVDVNLKDDAWKTLLSHAIEWASTTPSRTI